VEVGLNAHRAGDINKEFIKKEIFERIVASIMPVKFYQLSLSLAILSAVANGRFVII
jgi:hypothetical protein